jgi:prepilin-type processing-associated H-X9-DG protein
MNFTGASTVVRTFLCPSAVRQGDTRDGIDPNDPITQAFGFGYGVNDYGPTNYTDINPAGVATGFGGATPYRLKASRANGLLKQGMTRLAEITDGTSNTVAIGEDAGRDATFLSPNTEGFYDANGDPRPILGLGPAGGLTPFRRYWRWAEPDESYGVSGQPNNKFRPMHEAAPFQSTGVTAGNNAGANDELFSYHPGGVNCLFGDGSVRFIKETIGVVTLRSIITLSGGEVVSADQF